MRKIALLFAAFAALVIGTSPLSAHASLVRADPPPNSVLSVSPPTLSLWFDEDLDPQFSTVTLLDVTQKGVDLKNVRFSPDRKQMSVDVRPNLPPGAYTVSWRALSAVDGHTTKGVYAIFIGAASAGQPVVLSQTGTEASALPLPFDVFLRWLNLLAALSLCGVFTLNLLMGDAQTEFADVRAASARRMRVWVVVILLVLFVGAIVAQLLQTAAAAERSVGEVLAQSVWLQTLTTTRFGQAGLARILLVDGLLVMYAANSSPDRWRIRRLWNARALDVVYFVMSALVLLSISLASHAASSPDPLKLALVMDWLHLLAVGAWTGGLFALALILHPALNPLSPAEQHLPVTRTILKRFSNVAVASVALFALTGLYAMWRQVGHPNAIATPYGITVIVKNLMLAPLLLIGLINTLILRADWLSQSVVTRRRVRWLGGFAVGALERISRSAGQPLTVLRYARIEAILGALVVLAAATLTALPPARTAVPPPLPPPFQSARQAGEVKVSLGIDPYIVGSQTFTVKVTDLEGRPLPNVQRVNMRFTFLGADLGTSNQEMQSLGNGVYELKGGHLSVVGAWKAEIVVRRRDVEDDLRVPYRLNAIDPVTSRAEEAPYINSSIAFAIFDLIAGIALLFFSQRRNIVEGKWIGGGAIALGLTLFLMGVLTAPPATATILTNPIVPDEASLARGKAIYEENCIVCHGPAGRGNGPLAVTLNPRPADFVLHINQHSDEVTFNWISKGIPGTAMPGWAEKYSETDRWHVINYIQTLVERANAAAPTRSP